MIAQVSVKLYYMESEKGYIQLPIAMKFTSVAFESSRLALHLLTIPVIQLLIMDLHKLTLSEYSPHRWTPPCDAAGRNLSSVPESWSTVGDNFELVEPSFSSLLLFSILGEEYPIPAMLVSKQGARE